MGTGRATNGEEPSGRVGGGDGANNWWGDAMRRARGSRTGLAGTRPVSETDRRQHRQAHGRGCLRGPQTRQPHPIGIGFRDLPGNRRFGWARKTGPQTREDCRGIGGAADFGGAKKGSCAAPLNERADARYRVRSPSINNRPMRAWPRADLGFQRRSLTYQGGGYGAVQRRAAAKRPKF